VSTTETTERHQRRLGYERKRLEDYLPPLRVLIEKQYGPSFERVLARRGATKGGYPAALLVKALAIEDLGGDAVAVLERAARELAAIQQGSMQADPAFFNSGGGR